MWKLLKSLFTEEEDLWNHPVVTPLPYECIRVPRICAVFDQPYKARYGRFQGQRFYTYVGSVKPGELPGAQYGRSVSADTLRAQDIDPQTGDERCAWCGVSDMVVFCSGCQQFVCAGQLQRKGWRGHKPYFHCRESCGTAFWGAACSGDFPGEHTTQDNRPNPIANSNSNALSGQPSVHGNAGALPGRTNNTRLLK